MADLETLMGNLSAEKRALLERRLIEKRAAVAKQQVIPRRSNKEPCALSFAQELMWLLDQLIDTSAYHVPRALRIKGPLNVEALEYALNKIVARHEILRTTYQSVDGKPMQFVAPSATIDLCRIDLSGLDKERREVEANRILVAEGRRRFDFVNDLMLRAFLLRLDEQEHILLLVSHHIASDGQSKAVLFRELKAFYLAFCAGEEIQLPELPIQYADYAVWQREWLQGEVLENHLSYWRKQLAGAPMLLELPTDRPRPAAQSFEGARQFLKCPDGMLENFKSLCRQEGATLFMTMLAAFGTLLYRWSGQEDMLIGTPVSGRSRTEVEPLIGYFSNSVVLRVAMGGDPTFRDLIRRVKEVSLGTYSHQDLPFEKLVVEMQPERDLSYSPVYQIMFSVGEHKDLGLDLPGLNIDPIIIDRGVAKFDMTLGMTEFRQALMCNIEYCSALFEASTMQRLAGHFQNLLQGIIANPDQHISELPMLSAEDRRKFLFGWNDTHRDYPRNVFVPHLFERQVESTPDAIAAVYEDKRLTYRELNERANQVAHFLRKRKVGSEVRVAVCVERSLEMVIAVMGVMKAGGAYVPLDAMFARERLPIIMLDAECPVLLTQKSMLEAVPKSGAEVIALDSDWELIAKESKENLLHETTPDTLAYVVYTSGSTGVPKGVMVTHGGLVNQYRAYEESYELCSQVGSWLYMANFSFDVFSSDLTRSLCSGGKMVICPMELLLNPAGLYGLMLREDVDCAEFVPAVLHTLTAYLQETHQKLDFMRLLVCSSDAWSMADCRAVLAVCGDKPRVINAYGVTEATIDSTYLDISSPEMLRGEGFVPIGHPFANTRTYVLDRHMEPCPIGVPGVLYIGGAGVARGYLKRPELTAEKFVLDPFSSEPGARLYNTGDAARYLPDGVIEFLGRTDNQVKIRGFRIELGEIEAVLGKHTNVKQSVVVVRELTPGQLGLVAYVVPVEGSAVDIASLRSFIKGKLPAYMVPPVFVMLDSLPLTPNGKLDRRALAALEPIPVAVEDFVAPETPVEKLLAGIWEEVLRVSPISIHTNFFELGGHSLLAAQVISRIQKHLGIQLPLRSLFENPTISQLAKETGMTHQPDARVAEPAIAPLPRRDGVAPQPSPLSFAQQRLWVLDRLEPNSPAYNIPFSMRLTGHLNIGALESAFTEVVRRHEVLRTEFHAENGEPLQTVLASQPVSVAVVNLGNVPPAEREAQAMRLAIAEARKPFRLGRGPLIRASLLRLAESEHILLISVHHIAFDGWSTATLLAELSRLYAKEVRGEPSTLPELPCQYRDFAVWQRKLLQGERLEQQLSYWRHQLAGAPGSVDLPTDRPRGPIQTFRGSSQTVVITQPVLQRLQDLSRGQGVTLFMTLLAAFNVSLSRYSGQDDLVVGTPIAGRSRPELEKLIGLFVNTLVLRTDVSGDPSFAELLGRVREVAMGAYAHQDIPFERLVEELGPERDMSRNPLFQIMFGLHNVPRDEWQLPGLALTPFPVDRGTEKFDLSVSLTERANGLKTTFNYNTDLFDAATIARMMDHFQKLLEELVADPARRISEFSHLTNAERHKVLFGFNNTAVDYRHDFCVHNFFEAQAERSPDATALVCERERLNYNELNARANRLGHYLQKHGVGPEVPVAICMERSADMLVGILAILKAGGAYVPLDPAYPTERLATILEDAQAPILLTQASLVDILPQHTAQVIRLDADWPEIAAESDTNPVSNVKPENLSYVLFTSGSTGRPKGVAIQHSSAATLIQWAQNVFMPEEVSGTLFSTSVCFDLSAFEMFVPLSMGGKIIMAQNALSLPKLPAAREVTLINTVPSAIAELVRTDAVPASVEVINLAGEALPASLAQKVYRNTKVRKIYNLYGPTEDTTYSTYALVPRDGEVTIGKPLSNTQVYILDANQQLTPIGVPGELYLAGAGLARGYFGRPDLTAERFLPNPFSSEPGARMYRTGDLARFLADGNIQYLRRMDHQVKIRGFRIELGEIESLLAKHPLVQSAVAVAREDKSGNKRLVAYVVCSSGQDVSSTDLREFLKERLPDYMLPAAFMTLEALPLTPNGKVNRGALPAPDWSQIENTQPVAARDQLELMLLKTWENVLGVSNIGIEDNFFDLGGDSLLAARVVSEAENIAGREIPLSALFRGATIGSLAQMIREGSASSPDPLVMEIQGGNGGLPFFAVASPGVAALGYGFLARHMGPDQPVYKLQARAPVAGNRPFTEQELGSLSEEYIAAMRAVQPEGPYCFGGMCEGVQIAERMVLDLEAQGDEVGLFVILDTWVLQHSQRPWLWRIHYYRDRLRRLRRLNFVAQLQVCGQTLTNYLKRVTGRAPVRTEWLRAYWPENFTPPRFRAPIALFKRPKQPFYYVDDPHMGWGARTHGGVEIHEVNLRHLEILREPYVRALGEKLGACMQRVNSRTSNLAQRKEVVSPSLSTISSGVAG